MAGFFDADGCVTMDKTNGRLSITLTQKTREILEPLIDIVRRLTIFTAWSLDPGIVPV